MKGIALLLLALATPAIAAFEAWTSADGRTAELELVSLLAAQSRLSVRSARGRPCRHCLGASAPFTPPLARSVQALAARTVP